MRVQLSFLRQRVYGLNIWYKYTVVDVIEVGRIPDQYKDAGQFMMMLSERQKQSLKKIDCRIITIEEEPRLPRVWKFFGWPPKKKIVIASEEDSLFPKIWVHMENEGIVMPNEAAEIIWFEYVIIRDKKRRRKEILNRLAKYEAS